MSPVFIFGSSGHALDVADIVAAIGRRPVFVLERNAPPLADEETIGEDEVERHAGEDFAIGIGVNAVRRRVAERHSGLTYPALIHPDTSFGRGQRALIDAAPGTVVFAGVRFTHASRIGDFCHFNLNATVSHDVAIGHFVSLSPGAHITGNVVIGDDVLIGIGATVNQGLRIGARTTIGSGAAVIRDCDADSVYVGVPARKRP